MSKTVDELRNEIRVQVGRYERIESTSFTKEALAAICEAVNHDIDTDSLPPKSEMRAGIRRNVDGIADEDSPDGKRAFRKAELEAIAVFLRNS